MIKSIMQNAPAGISAKQLIHYGQLIKSGTFAQFDYKREKNLKVYDQPLPPLYNLSNIMTQMQIIYATQDLVLSPLVKLWSYIH